jgi:hypothetical protein
VLTTYSTSGGFNNVPTGGNLNTNIHLGQTTFKYQKFEATDAESITLLFSTKFIIGFYGSAQVWD